MHPLRTVIQRALEPLAAIRPVLFLVGYALAAWVWGSGTGEVELGARIAHPDLRAVLQLFLRVLDPVLLVLAALVLHQCASAAEGLKTARNWVLLSFSAALVVAWSNQLFGFPLGPLAFTSRLGPAIFHAPLGWCLLWYALFVGARALALSSLPRAGHASIATISGLLTGLSGLLLELGARQIRSWWIWNPGMLQPSPQFPFSFPLTMGFLSFLTAFVLRPPGVQTLSASPERLASAVFLLLNLLFLAPHLHRFMA